MHVVIGTSGLTADDYAELDRLAGDRGVGVIAAGNFSVMAAVLRHAAAMAARHLGALGDHRLRQRHQARRAQRHRARPRRDPGPGARAG